MLTALATTAVSSSHLGRWTFYEIDIEREPTRPLPAPAPPAMPEAPRAPEPGAAPGIAEGLPEGVPEGDPVPFAVGPGARVGERAAPAAARAGRVLTSGDESVADFSIVQGNAERYAGGVSAATGTSKVAVTDPRAEGAGVIPPRAARAGTPSSTPKAAPRPPPPRALPPSRATPAVPVSQSWSCAFPPEADQNQVNYARVLIAVTVSAAGRATNVVLLSDPGDGFGRAARSCAFRQRFVPPRGPDGNPTTGTTAPFHVTFTR